MDLKTCVIIGGGYAGIQTIHALQKLHGKNRGMPKLRIVLIDKNPYHLRKVLLFKPAARASDIKIPFAQMFSDQVTLVQGVVTAINAESKCLRYEDVEGCPQLLNYDVLVVSIGSILQTPPPLQGGVALSDPSAAEMIRERWQENLRMAGEEPNRAKREQLMTIAVVGAGISGTETSAELAYSMRKEANNLKLNPSDVRVYLVNAHERLFMAGPEVVGRRLEKELSRAGVTVLHGCKALYENNGLLTLTGHSPIPAGLCVWTIGLLPGPKTQDLGLPLMAEGKVMVDASYRVQGDQDIYSIGDCANIVDPRTGRRDTMTCKEASGQAIRLARVIIADLAHRPAPSHKSYMDIYCFSLGPKRGMVWLRWWGLDMIMTGRIGLKFRQYTWDNASLIK